MSLSVLLVDDSSTIRAVITKTLGLTGIEISEIREAGNGQEALDVLEENWVDVIFADINMPVMNGVEMIEKLYDDDILSKIPIVVVSTEGSQKRVADLRNKGVVTYIRKPFTPEAIKEALELVLELKKND
jgi:two-component system chemotaxis response regulator CheY